MQDRFDNTIERIAPARSPSVAADVVVPLLQSLITGSLIGGPVGAGVWAIGGHEVVIPALILIIAAADWKLRLSNADRSMWSTERRLGADLDGDGHIGEPTKELERIIGLNPYQGQRAREETERSAQASRMAEFLRDAWRNSSMAHLGGRGYDRETEIQPWRDSLIQAGWRVGSTTRIAGSVGGSAMM